MRKRLTTSAIVRQPGEGEVLRAGPTVSVVKVAGTSTEDRLGAVEMHLEAGWDGPPAHVHERVDHLWYVLAGEALLTIDGRRDRYAQGSCLFVPAGTPHAFGTGDDSAAAMLQVDTPQSLDGYFRELVETFPPGLPVDPARVADIMRRHDTRPRDVSRSAVARLDPMEHNDALLTRSFELAAEARAAGDHPFGALFEVDGHVVAEARNRIYSDHDMTAHAETALVLILEREHLLDQAGGGTLYASCEPCPMCVGAMFWAGVRRVVFGLSSALLMELATPPGNTPVGFTITAAEIGGAAIPPMHFDGPHREDEAAIPHHGFWVP